MWGISLQDDDASRDLHITVQAKYTRIRSPFSSDVSIVHVEQRGARPTQQTLSSQSQVMQHLRQTCFGCGPSHMTFQQDTRPCRPLTRHSQGCFMLISTPAELQDASNN